MSQITNRELYEEINKLRLELVTRDEHLEEKVDKTYLRIQVFESEINPLRKFVYGLISIAGASLLTALMALLIKS